MNVSFLNNIFGYNKENYIGNKTDNNNNIDKLCKKLPYELVNIILDYDGQIKYKYKTKNSIDYHKYVNVIHKHDNRYSIITRVIDKKKYIIMHAYVSPVDTGFFSRSRLTINQTYFYAMIIIGLTIINLKYAILISTGHGAKATILEQHTFE